MMIIAKMKKTLAVLSALAVSSVSAFTLTPDTKIVVPDPENIGVAAALTEGARALARDLEEGTGMKIPVVPAAKAGGIGNAVYIGGVFAEKAGLMPVGDKTLKEFENVVAAKNGNLYLFGADKPGHKSSKRLGWTECVLPSLKALTNFMEKDLGIRFLYPGDTGRDVPKMPRVEVAEGTFRRHTPNLNCGNGRYFEMMYCIANNIFGDGLYKTYGGHLYPYAVPTQKYFKDHPEYFGLIGKGRQCEVGNPTLCISNKDVEDIIVGFIADRFDEGYDVVELGQNDGSAYCRCESCASYGGVSDPGEQFWLFHKRIAERLNETHPHKTVQIISYGHTYQPPKTFTEFPPNVMIELMKNSPKSLRVWKKYKVPRGFSNYLYNFGTYQLTGYTAHPSVPYVAEDARRIVEYGIRSIYRCGYGEKFGMEGPVSYVFNRLLDDPSLKPDRLMEEFCARAFGPAGTSMKRFYDILDKKLRGVNKMREGFESPGDSVAAIQAQTGNPNELMTYVYSTDTMRSMETLLRRSERAAGLTAKQIRRLKLVRLEFDYAVKIAKVAHLYSAYRLNPTEEFFRPLGVAVKDRRAYVNSLYDKNGRMRKIDGWPELTPFSGAGKRILTANGYLQAILPTPFGWDIDFMNERGILPGSGVRRQTVKRLAANPSFDDFEGGAWKDVPWNKLDGIQLEKISNTTKFKVGYDAVNLYVAVDTTLADAIEVPAFGHDGGAWTTEALEIIVDPFGEREKYYHFIYNPAPKSCYDAAFGFIEWPEDPLYNKPDPSWNGKWSYETKRGGDRWRSLVTIPFATLGIPTPEKGAKICFNVAREGGEFGKMMDRGNPELAIWSPNLEERSFHGRDSMGELTFE